MKVSEWREWRKQHDSRSPGRDSNPDLPNARQECQPLDILKETAETSYLFSCLVEKI
jgi:hypothetical protein